MRPVRGRQGVVEPGRERVLGREPVVDRQDRTAALDGQSPREVVVRVEIADHPPSAVEVDEEPEPVVIARAIETAGYIAAVHRVDLVDVDRRRELSSSNPLPHRRRRALLEEGIAERLQNRQHLFGLRVQCHRPAA